MFKPNKVAPMFQVLVLLIPFGALAGISVPTDDPGAVRAAPSEKTAKAPGGYQLRCWQEGRLLFEENHVALPVSDGAPYRVRLAATDRKGQPIYVAETSNATCLIRKAAEERSAGR
jgi:hypothetical protein